VAPRRSLPPASWFTCPAVRETANAGAEANTDVTATSEAASVDKIFFIEGVFLYRGISSPHYQKTIQVLSAVVAVLRRGKGHQFRVVHAEPPNTLLDCTRNFGRAMDVVVRSTGPAPVATVIHRVPLYC
jgi:hypothetical protein